MPKKRHKSPWETPGTIVYAGKDFTGRLPSGPVFGVTPDRPVTHFVQKGTPGILCHEVPNEPGLWVVDFEYADSDTMAVETEVTDLTIDESLVTTA